MKKWFALVAGTLLATSAFAGQHATVNVWNGELNGSMVNVGSSTVTLEYVSATSGTFPSSVDVDQRAFYQMQLPVGETATLVYAVNSYGDMCEFNFRNNGSVYLSGGVEKVDITAYGGDWWDVDCEVDQTGLLRVGGFSWDWDWDDWDDDCWFEDEYCAKGKPKAKA